VSMGVSRTNVELVQAARSTTAPSPEARRQGVIYISILLVSAMASNTSNSQ
jgi:hypothetical protein